MRTKLTVVIKENKSMEQMDEILPGPAVVTHAYKWLGPLHDMINMANPETKGVFKSFFEWYHRNDTVQALGNAFSMAEDAMNNMWESGKIGKSNALALQSMIGLGDITGATASSTVGAFMSTVRNAMEKKKQDEFEAAKKRVEDAEKEEARAQEVKNLKSLINKMEIAHAKKLLALADKLKKEARKTDDEKGERMAPISQTQQNDAYVNEDKKMTKKYSSFKDQHRITENFRRFINEEEEAHAGFMDIAPDQRAFWIFDMWIPESVEKMQRIVERRARGARFRGTMDTLGDVIRSDFINWAYDEARDKMGSEWEGDEDGWEDAVEDLGHKREELLNSDELLGKIKEILKWDKGRWVDAGLSVAPDY